MKENLGLSLSLRQAASSRSLGLILFGISIGGFSYIGYNNRIREKEYQKLLLNSGQKTHQKQISDRLSSTLLYFAGSITTTAGLVAFMMKRPGIIMMSLNTWTCFLTIPGFILCSYKMQSIPNNSQSSNLVKHGWWLAMNGLVSFSIAPLIAFSNAKLVADAFLLTSGCFAGLGFAAYNSHDSAFLGMGGILGAGMGTLMAVSIANIFFQSHALFNFWLYGGLAIFLGFTLYDLKNIKVRAERALYFDPMNESLHMYIDFINIFVRILMIMQNRKNK